MSLKEIKINNYNDNKVHHVKEDNFWQKIMNLSIISKIILFLLILILLIFIIWFIYYIIEQ